MSKKEDSLGVNVHEDFYSELITPKSIQKCEFLVEGRSQDDLAYQLHSISPFGCQIGVHGREVSRLSRNQSVTVILIHPKYVSKCEGTLVDIKQTSSVNHLYLLSIKWTIGRVQRSDESDERRASQRFVCSEEFRPTGVVKNPFKFNDFIFFQVLEVSSGGLKIRTSMRNRALTPNLVLKNVSISFPTINQINVDLRLLEASLVGDKAVWRCEFDKKTRADSRIIGQYLLQFSGAATAKELKKQGMQVKSVTKSISFEWVRTKEDYQKVLELRTRAWRATGAIGDDVTPDFFADEFDSRSKILFGSHHDKAVASLRFVYSEPTQPMEHSKFFKNGWPNGMPPLEDSVELTRVVTDPDYREQDLLYSIFQQTVIAMVQSEKRYFIGNADVSLHKLYTSLGCKFIGDNFNIPKLKLNARLMIGDARGQILGVNVNPVVWNLLFSDMCEFCVENGLIKPTLKDKTRIRAYKALKPVAWVINRQLSKVKKKK